MLHHAETRHFELGLECLQRAAVTLKQEIQEKAPRGVGKCLEYEVVVCHRRRIGDYMVTCQDRRNQRAKPSGYETGGISSMARISRRQPYFGMAEE
jgi:hypothetical protein